MKPKAKVIISAASCAAVVAGTVIATFVVGGHGYKIVLEENLKSGKVMEYSGTSVQFPLAHIENDKGEIISYDVKYSVVDQKSGKEKTNEYATFELGTGKYKIIYSDESDKNNKKDIEFEIKDTKSPEISFTNIPRGLFLQDIKEDDIQKLPLYTINDASMLDGIDLEKKLYFKGDGDTDFKEVTFKEINNSYTVSQFGTFKYEIKATDKYGNSATNSTNWLVKDRNWKPAKMPSNGILADYSSDGYLNYFEPGDANQYYKIGNDYEDSWLEEYEGAKGVLKADLSFNNAAGWGNNCVRLYFARKLTRDELKGKYLAVRMRVEGKNIRDNFLFAGSNVEFRKEDQTMRAFSTEKVGLETDKWMTFYIDGDLAEDIGVFPGATYNPSTTVYDGGAPANYIQLCFSRVAGYTTDMTLYVDSISVAQKLQSTDVKISGNRATWDKVDGAVGYLVNLNGNEKTVTDTSVRLDGKKGYVRVKPLGDGVLTLDAEESNAIYGVDPHGLLAAFDDPLYCEMFTDKLNFSTEQEHIGYKPKEFSASYGKNCVNLELGTGNWGVCSGIKMIFPKPMEKGDNTSIVLRMNISNSSYSSMRVFDYDGKLLSNIKLSSENTGKMQDYVVDIGSYDKVLKGLQFVFGPSNGMKNVAKGVSLTFESIALKNNYYTITVDGRTMTCVGNKELTPGYSTNKVVQFTDFFDFGVPEDNTPLSFEGTLLINGKSEKANFIGYKNNKTICLNTPHNGNIVTVMKGSKIYYGDKVAIVDNTFNAYWNGKNWVNVGKIPDPPADEYITVNNEQKLVLNKTKLTPGYTTENLVQFIDFSDFGADTDDTPLKFSGDLRIDGKKIPEESVKVVGYKNNTTICFNVPHKDKILTVTKGSIVYYANKAVVINETFNAYWNGENWVNVSEIPNPPADEYITVNNEQKLVVDNIKLNAGYTTENLVQFTQFYDFGAKEDNEQLYFSGKLMIDGKELSSENVDVVGYPKNTTICFNVPHKGKVLTIMKDSVVYSGDKAVVISETFNAHWDGNKWITDQEIPTPPADEYVTVGGQEKLVVDKIKLTPGYTQNVLVQFTECYDFKVPNDNTLLSFEGKILIDGKEITSDGYNFIGYSNNRTLCLNIPHNGKVLTIMKDSVIAYGDNAIVITETFNAHWDGSKWVNDSEIPAPQGYVSFAYNFGNSTLIQFKTDLPANTTCKNFLSTDNGSSILQEGAQPFGWASMVKGEDNCIYIGFVFNDAFSVGQSYILKKGSVFKFSDGSTYTLNNTVKLKFTENGWVEDNLGEITFENIIESNSKHFVVETDLPDDTPLKDFLVTDNGCSILESGYKNVGYIAMTKNNGKICLGFYFNVGYFKNKQYVLGSGSVFKFTDGSSYTLSKDYTFKFNGSIFTME